MRFPRLRLALPLCHSVPLTWRRMRVLAVIEDAVTVLEVGMNHFPPRINSPFTGVHSPLKHLAWIMGLVWRASPCLCEL